MSATCPNCGKPVPPSALRGLCPECMLALGAASQTDTGGGAGLHGTKTVPSPPAKPEEIGKHFPQLEILECLGRGGMGVVYKARQPRLDRLVALKILAPEKEQDPKFAERFTREAKALARLNHPNIVTVYDFGEAEGMFYLLMEYVDGVTLRQLLQTRKIAPEEALSIVPKICDALQFAHELGVVHRDIKPENVLLDRQGRVKIADFGIAKIMAEVSLTPSLSPSDGERMSGRTGEGKLTQDQVLGTPNYMAPEQVEHPQTVDHRADIYSLGVVFYEMLTGELPLGRYAPPSARMHGIKMDVRMDEVVLHALEKEPELRYQQASQVKTAVETIAATAAPRPPSAHESADLESARDQVKVPAISLIVLSGLTLLLFAVWFPIWTIAAAASIAGKTSGLPWTLVMPIGLVMTGCNLVSFVGAWRMRQLRSYRLAVVGSILFMLSPCLGLQSAIICKVSDPVWSNMPYVLLGLIFGIWPLIVLSRRQVQEAFKANRARRMTPPEGTGTAGKTFDEVSKAAGAVPAPESRWRAVNQPLDGRLPTAAAVGTTTPRRKRVGLAWTVAALVCGIALGSWGIVQFKLQSKRRVAPGPSLTGVSLTSDQVEAYVAQNKRNAESLLAAYRMSADVLYLKEAADKFPGEREVQYAVIAAKAFPEAQRQWIESYKASSPDNALAWYFSALEYFRAGQTNLAVQELAEATRKPAFRAELAPMLQAVEEMNLSAGRTADEAKMTALAACAFVPHLTLMRDLASAMEATAQQYRQQGDSAAAESLAGMGLVLGHHLEAGGGSQMVINQLVGVAIEKRFVPLMDPNGRDPLGRRVSEVSAAIAQHAQTLKGYARMISRLQARWSAAERATYLERVKLYGEEAALSGLKAKQEGPDTRSDMRERFKATGQASRSNKTARAASIGVTAREIVVLTPASEAAIKLPYRLSWQPIDGAKRYAIRISEIRGKEAVCVKETTGTEIMIEPAELKAGRNYYWHLDAMDATGRKAATTEGPCGTGINCFAVVDDQEKQTRPNGKKVLLDFSHRESDIRGFGVYNFSQHTAYRLLQGEGCEVATNSERHLLDDYLKDYDLVILHSKYAGPILPFIPGEIAALREFVSEGGKLFVACWGSGGGADGPDFYNPLLRAFGIEVRNIEKPDFREATFTTDNPSPGGMRIFLQCPADVFGTNCAVLAAAPSGKPVMVKKNIGQGVVVVSGAGMAFQDSYMAGNSARAADNQKAFLAMINQILFGQ